MKDSEFYDFDENWPQPPDDPCTLEVVQELSHGAKHRKKLSSARTKKKLSESLAGVTAAAVAVVMLSTSIPSLKDSCGEFPEFIGTGEVCPVCGSQGCPYFSEGYSGLKVTLVGEAEHLESNDLYSMAGFSSFDSLYDFSFYPCIPMESGERAVMRLQQGFVHSLPISEVQTSQFHFNTDCSDEAEHSYTGILCRGIEEKNPTQSCYLYILLAYSSSGDVPLIEPATIMEETGYIDFNSNNTSYRTYPVSGHPELAVQIFTNLDEQILDVYSNKFDVFVIKDEYLEYEFGKTMLLKEDEFIRRSFDDHAFSNRSEYRGFNTDNGNEMHCLTLNFLQKEYSFYMNYYAIFTPFGWKTVFDHWMDLNEQALKTGHEIYFPAEELNSITVNGIEYSCYIVYTASAVDDVNNYPWIQYYMVPKQEDTVAIVDQRSISPEMLQKLLETREIDDAIAYEDFLKQITLR